MNPEDKIDRIRSDFVVGRIQVEDLLLHVETVLMEAATGRGAQHDVREIVNAIEEIIFTHNETTKSDMIVAQLRRAIAFLRALLTT